MNKMNKKGFTLIEMLVVIAIIAILVSIIIPAVSSSTARAAAATDAANLRSAKAVISIGLLDGTYEKNTAKGVITADKCGVPNESKYDKTKTFNAAIDGEGNVYVAYGDLTIEDLADLADDGQDNGTVSGGTLAPDGIGSGSGGSGSSSGGSGDGDTTTHTCAYNSYDASGHTCTNTETACPNNNQLQPHEGMTDNDCDVCDYAITVTNHTCTYGSAYTTSGHTCTNNEGTCPNNKDEQGHTGMTTDHDCDDCDYNSGHSYSVSIATYIPGDRFNPGTWSFTDHVCSCGSSYAHTIHCSNCPGWEMAQ